MGVIEASKPQVTQRQMDVLLAIRDYRRRHGYAPTYMELAELLGVSKVTIFEKINDLERKRIVKRDRHKARSLEIVDSSMLPRLPLPRLPVLGIIGYWRNKERTPR